MPCIGCGLNVNGSGVIEVDLADPGSGLHCDNTNGLSLEIKSTDADCILLGGSGTTIDPLVAAAQISVQSCNGITCRTGANPGLYANCPDNIVGSVHVGSFGGGVFPFAITGPNADYDRLSQCSVTATSSCPAGTDGRIRICNTICCPVEGIWRVRAYGGFLSVDPAANLTWSLFVSINGGAFAAAAPLTTTRFTNQGAGTVLIDMPHMEDSNYVGVLNLNDCFDIQAMVRVHIDTGTGMWMQGPDFEFYWQLNQTGCACT